MCTAHKILSYLVVAIVLLPGMYGQTDSTRHSFGFDGDMRFRVEQDWNSRRANGTFRNDRSRMRIRARAGMTYQAGQWIEMGLGVRTGNPGNQQDPNITLGLANNEYSAFAIGVHKAFMRLHGGHFSGWLGKNTFPFETQNELFWSSAVYPEGVTLQFNTSFQSGAITNLKITAGHYIATASNRGFGRDGYLQGLQTAVSVGNRLRLIPGLFLFRNMADIPDGKGTYQLNYSILHLGGHVVITRTPSFRLGLDYYHNLEDYNTHASVPAAFAKERAGLAISAKLGALRDRGDWIVNLYLTRLERYAIVDYFAQNDWARWDYSGAGSPASRLSNLRGLQIHAGYALERNITLVMKAYRVVQIIPTGTHKETGSRIRFDLNVSF